MQSNALVCVCSCVRKWLHCRQCPRLCVRVVACAYVVVHACVLGSVRAGGNGCGRLAGSKWAAGSSGGQAAPFLV